MPEEKSLVFEKAKIITPMRIIPQGTLVVQKGKIVRIGPTDEIVLPRNLETIIDVAGKYLAPGFVDIHVHGGNGADVMDATEEALERMSIVHAEGGTTSMVATTSSAL